MEFLPGEQLSNLIEREGPMDWREAIPLLLQICDALDYAHKMDIIHRDIKPSNIVLLRNDDGKGFVVKLVDFGIAKSLTQSGPQLTQTEMILGSGIPANVAEAEAFILNANDATSRGVTSNEIVNFEKRLETMEQKSAHASAYCSLARIARRHRKMQRAIWFYSKSVDIIMSPRFIDLKESLSSAELSNPNNTEMEGMCHACRKAQTR